MKHSKIYLLILALISMAGTCKEQMNQNQECNTHGLVVDMTGLDGCGLMIQLDNGNRLEVVGLPENAEPLKAGEELWFSYEEAQDMASICMAGKMVNISCISSRSLANNESCPSFNYAVADEMNSAPQPSFNLIEHKTIGTQLHIKVGVSGCDADRDFKLLMSQAQMKSLPPQSPCVLSFSEQACEAYFMVDLCFDLKELGEKTLLLLRNGDSTERVMYNPQ